MEYKYDPKVVADEAVALGKQLGYEGKELQDFVRDERAARREEFQLAVANQEKRLAAEAEQRRLAAESEQRRLAAEADQRKAEAEADQRKAEADQRKAEAEERRLAAESEQRKLAAEEREKERQHELRLGEMRKDEGNEETGRTVRGSREHVAVRPKLPHFDPSRESIDAYITRFEQFAASQGWELESWATSLSALLKGESLSVYYRLPKEQYNDYDSLKKALLLRYQCTEEGFRKKFRYEKPEKGESFKQFTVRLRGYLERWVELSESNKTYEELSDLLLREQVLNVVSPELRVFLKERKPDTVDVMAELAENYLEVHGKVYNYWAQKGPDARKKKHDKPSDGNGKKGEESGRDKRESDRRSRTCFLCHKSGHYANACRERGKPDSKSDSASKNMSSMHVIFSKSDTGESQILAGDGSKLPIQVSDPGLDVKSALFLGEDCLLPHVKGRFGKDCTDVTILRDTGSNGVIVRRVLCNPDDYTGEMGSCTFVNGSKVKAPIVRVFVDCPFYKGVTCALAMESPFFDVVIGNVPGARNASDPDPDWGLPGKSTLQEEASDSVSTATSDVEVVVSKGKRAGRSSAVYDNKVCSGVKSVCDQAGAHLWTEASQGSGNVPEGSCELVTMEGESNSVSYDSYASCEAECVRELEGSKFSASVVTRSQAKKAGLKPLVVSDSGLLQVSRSRLIELQKEDASLDKCWRLVSRPQHSKRSWFQRFYVDHDVLCREHTSSIASGRKVTKQVVLPKILREGVMQLAHDSILGGHLGTQKTVNRVLGSFFWPGIVDDVKRYCASCDICQRTVPRGRIGKVPLGATPIIETPFARVAVDLVGPLPVSANGFRYIFTLVDFATRFPEAIPLKRIETVDVAEAMMAIFSRVGVPREILSDRGSQFTSEMMSELSRLLSIKQLRTTPYHAMANGMVERFNGVLKSMLRKMAGEKPKDWDRYLNPLLFAYREVPQEGVGFSPFELLYGRTVRGPMMILKELWSGLDLDEEVRSTYQYVMELRERLEDTCNLAHQVLTQNKLKQKRWFDKKARNRSFKVGDQVLLLLPSDSNKLLMQWKGPFEVTEKVAEADYRIDINGKSKIFHANMLKSYVTRDTTDQVSANVLIDLDDQDSPESFFCPLESTECVSDVRLHEDLSEDQRLQIQDLLGRYESIFTDLPGRTSLTECHIRMIDETPIRQRPYPVPISVRNTMTEEVRKMQRMGVIEDSSSDFCNPSLLVRKPDGSHRYCIDFRKVNSMTMFDSEPIPQQDQIIARLGQSKFFTKIDLSKGFWQIPIKKEDRHKTAFATEDGLKQFVVMPFGLVNASSVFCRMMRKLLMGLENVESYIDDVVVHSQTWEEHICALEKLFSRLRESNLTVRPSKCHVGCREIDFLGQRLGNGVVVPQKDKVDKILEIQRPADKKELRSYLGSVGFHRKFIKDFSTHASVLTDMLAKGKPNQLRWTTEAVDSFEYFKRKLAEYPVLRLFDTSKEVTVAVDSSNVGLGAVVLQSHEGQLCPVMYLSRKLRPAETRYSTIERECLAVVWAIKTLHCYLYGREFVLLSDHQPLSYLHSSRYSNSRIMRWALDLQVYRFRVQVIQGVENHTADYLSRRGAW